MIAFDRLSVMLQLNLKIEYYGANLLCGLFRLDILMLSIHSCKVLRGKLNSTYASLRKIPCDDHLTWCMIVCDRGADLGVRIKELR